MSENPPQGPGKPENPIDPRPDSTPRWAEVIDLAEVRVEFGLPRNRHERCAHRSLTYNVEERRVWCRDCERSIDGFDAFMVLVRNFAAMEQAARAKMTQAEEAKSAHIGRRAAKKLDQAWSGQQMAVGCPHCNGGLLPEDFEHVGMRSRELELARRARLKGEGGQ